MFENSVAIQDGAHEEVLCPHCDEPLVFGMKDNAHEFSIGLTKILECLVVAEHMGYVPPSQMTGGCRQADVTLLSRTFGIICSIKGSRHARLQAENRTATYQAYRKRAV